MPKTNNNTVNPFEGKDPKEVWLQIKANSTTRDKVMFFEEAADFMNNEKEKLMSRK